MRQERAPSETVGGSADLGGDGGGDVGGTVGGGGGEGARRFIRGRDRSQRLSDECSTSSRPRLVGGALEEEEEAEHGEDGGEEGGGEEAEGETTAVREMPPGEACFEVGDSGT